MSNRLITATFIASISAIAAQSCLQASNRFNIGEVSRYGVIEPVDDNYAFEYPARAISSGHSGFNNPLSQTAAQTTQSVCDDAAYLDSSCIVNLSLTRQGLQSQLQYLQKYPQHWRFANLGNDVSNDQLKTTLQGVLHWLDHQQVLIDHFELVDISNYHSRKTKFTGYYTPEVAASRHYSWQYRYPVYRAPGDHRKHLSRAEIDRGALAGRGLEVAWVKNPLELFYLHMQGSGVLVFEDGSRKTLKFEDSNGHDFKSIARYMQQQGYLGSDLSRRAIADWLQRHPEKTSEVLQANPRYVFFSMKERMASSASGQPLIPGHTVAVDTSFIPFGSVLLAEIPTIGQGSATGGYEWRMLFPQDRGNAIKGQARIDLYMGVGEQARQWANHVTGFRRAFLLLDKKSGYLQTASAGS